MIKLLAKQSNGRNFLDNAKEMRIYIGVNYTVAVNYLQRTAVYWDFYHFVGKVCIQHIFTRARYQEVLQNVHFAENTKQEKTDKGYDIKPIIHHLNELFQSCIFKQA